MKRLYIRSRIIRAIALILHVPIDIGPSYYGYGKKSSPER